MRTRSLRWSILLALSFSVHLNANEVPLAEVTRQANAGDASAARNLGQAYLSGRGVPQSTEQGLGWLKKGVDRHDPLSAYALAQYYETLPQTAENHHSVLENYSKAASWGHTDAQVKIGDMLLIQSLDTQLSSADRERAKAQGKSLLEFSANAGNAHAAKHLGDLYFEGKSGIPENRATAMTYYQKAADAGDGTSAMVVYDRYAGASKPKTADLATGMKYLKIAADKDVPEAQLKLAQCYEQGKGVPLDRDNALGYAKRAAANGAHEADAIVLRLTPHPAPIAAPVLQEKSPVLTVSEETRVAQAAPIKRDAVPILESAQTQAMRGASDIVSKEKNTDTARATSEVAMRVSAAALAAKDIAPPTTKFADSEKAHDENVMLRDQLGEREQSLIELRAELSEARNSLKLEHEKLVAAVAAQHELQTVVVAPKSAPHIDPPAHNSAPLPASHVNPDVLNETAVVALQSGQYESAVRNFKLAADAGSQRAVNNLAMLYYRGVGVTRDIPVAIKYFEQAAAGGAGSPGNGSAANNLGFIYQNGVGVRPDTRAAIRWYTTAIQLGNKASLGNLQQLLARGVSDAPTAPDVGAGQPIGGDVAVVHH